MSDGTGPMRYVKPSVAEAHFGVHRKTLAKWADEGRIRSFQSGPGKQRLYDIASTGGVVPAILLDAAAAQHQSAAGTPDTPVGDRVDAVYARVSTRKQLGYLNTQTDRLKAAHPDALVFTDCASGLNFKRKGFLSLLELALKGRLRSVHVANRDRLCRFAFDLVEHVLKRCGTKVVVEAHDLDTSISPENELAEDVLAVITVFGARLYGKRGAVGRKRKRSDAVKALEATGFQATEADQEGAGTSLNTGDGSGPGSGSESRGEPGAGSGSGSGSDAGEAEVDSSADEQA